MFAVWKGAGYTGKRAVEGFRVISIDGITHFTILIQITIGADDNIINLWRYACNHMLNKRPAFELHQSFIFTIHALAFAASKDNATDIWICHVVGSRLCLTWKYPDATEYYAVVIGIAHYSSAIVILDAQYRGTIITMVSTCNVNSVLFQSVITMEFYGIKFANVEERLIIKADA